MTSDETIREAARRLKEAAPGATIILFGSHARGDARQGSDLDFLVVEPEVKARREEMVRLSDALDPLEVPVDIVVVSKKTFEEWRETPGTVIYTAAKEGRVLHAGSKASRLLMAKAAEDEYVLDKIMNDLDAPPAVFGFHAQQAAEKMLKAVIASEGMEYPFTHDIKLLFNLIVKQGIPLPEKFLALRFLIPFAAEFRYDPFPQIGRGPGK